MPLRYSKLHQGPSIKYVRNEHGKSTAEGTSRSSCGFNPHGPRQVPSALEKKSLGTKFGMKYYQCNEVCHNKKLYGWSPILFVITFQLTKFITLGRGLLHATCGYFFLKEHYLVCMQHYYNDSNRCVMLQNCLKNVRFYPKIHQKYIIDFG